MKLTEVFQGGQLNNSTQILSSQNAENTDFAGMAKTLTLGETLQGEVIAREGNQVQIQLKNDLILEAKVDGDICLEIGKLVTFEVKNIGDTLQLSPLFTNMTVQENVLKALEMASLPITENTISMTGKMMEANLPIDKVSLQQMFREVNSFPGGNAADVVDLHQMGLKVNNANLEQIHAYKNLTHQLVDGMHSIQQDLLGLVDGLVREGNVEEAARIFCGTLELVEEIAAEGSMDEAAPVSADVTQADREELHLCQEKEMQSAEKNSIPGEKEIGVQGSEEAQEKPEELVLKWNSKLWEGKEKADAPVFSDAGKEPLKQTAVQEKVPLKITEKSLWEADIKTLQSLLKQGIREKDVNVLKAVLLEKNVQKILSEGLSKAWTVTPQEVGKPGKVEAFYNRLNMQLRNLEIFLTENGQENSSAFRSVSSMVENIDFLQQINQTYTYVQLPLRMENGERHGDLYVYTNKRNLAAKDGQISALLHLDMEYLGPLDVYVVMQAEHVNTRFSVQDEEILDFLQQHMDSLTQRLQKKGYNCDFVMQFKTEENEKKDNHKSDWEKGLKGMTEREQGQMVARYAFDVRA